MGGVKRIEHNDKILAIVISPPLFSELQQKNKEIEFFTPNEFPFQMGAHRWQKAKKITEHFHLPFKRLDNFPVQEFFYLVSGRVRIDLYDERENDAKVSEIIVTAGDAVVLNTGHGMEALEPSQMIELKQGPYRGKELEKRFIEKAAQ
ncbi:MAG TPA: hypothetical protein VJH68_01765 [Candidatus Nanoarchaeia archaeon]|nr:hypothetical protein [Candidatus Nanoarchaeia archaeon]